MKKILFIAMVVILLMTGCVKKSESNVLKKFQSKVENLKSYHLTGKLEMVNNETVYTYDVEVDYEKKDQFRVSLKNTTNNHEQLILRNNQGVFVITPSLNKSFKFQSEWPYNNSQSYLPQAILKDLEKDKKKIYEYKKNKHIFISKVNYTNNNALINQRVTLDKEYNLETVEVLDKEGNVKIKMKFKDIDYGAKFNSNHFVLESNINVDLDVSAQVSKIDDVIYPMYIPINTTLKSQDKIKTSTGERVILTFDGEKPFMFIQETVAIDKNLKTMPVSGEPIMIGDSLAVVNGNSINWYNNGKEYYIASSSLNDEELLGVASSIGSVPVIK